MGPSRHLSMQPFRLKTHPGPTQDPSRTSLATARSSSHSRLRAEPNEVDQTTNWGLVQISRRSIVVGPITSRAREQNKPHRRADCTPSIKPHHRSIVAQGKTMSKPCNDAAFVCYFSRTTTSKHTEVYMIMPRFKAITWMLSL